MKKIGIQIFGENELRDRIKEGFPVMSHCISIRNSTFETGRQPFPLPVEIQFGFKDILHLEFHDLEKREWLPPGNENARLPEMEDIYEVIKFVKKASKDPDLTGFTIHCWRGVSRSAAIATGIIYWILKDEEKTAQYLKKIRPEAGPLPRIVKMWDKVFESNLMAEIAILRAERFAEMKKWFFDEIENGDALLEELEVIEEV